MAYWSTKLAIIIVAFVTIFAVLLILLSKKEKARPIITIILLVCVVVESLIFNWNNINTIEIDNELSENSIVSELTENLDDDIFAYFAFR